MIHETAGSPDLHKGTSPIFLESQDASLHAVFKLFHGPQGVIPLHTSCPQQNHKHMPFLPELQTTPAHSKRNLLSNLQEGEGEAEEQQRITMKVLDDAYMPYASMSLSSFGFPSPGDFFGRHRGTNRARRKPRTDGKERPKPRRAGGTNGKGGESMGGRGPTSTSTKPTPDGRGGSSSGKASLTGGRSCSLRPSGTSGAPSSRLLGGASTKMHVQAPRQRRGTVGSLDSSNNSSKKDSKSASDGGVGRGGDDGKGLKGASGGDGKNAAPSEGGRCPMRKFIEPFGSVLPLALASDMELRCPRAIVAMRAAIARSAPARELRPRGIQIRSLAMIGTAVVANVPCGMWRKHTKRFSPQWFVAVHATIPFVAMLRKAVLMPPWAILLTVGGAVGGQHVGEKLMYRIEQQRR